MEVIVNEGNNNLNVSMVPLPQNVLVNGYISSNIITQTTVHDVNGLNFSEVGEILYDGEMIPYARLASPIVMVSPQPIYFNFTWRRFNWDRREEIWRENTVYSPESGGEYIEFVVDYKNPLIENENWPKPRYDHFRPPLDDGAWHLPVNGLANLDSLVWGTTDYYLSDIYDLKIALPGYYTISATRPVVILGAVRFTGSNPYLG